MANICRVNLPAIQILALLKALRRYFNRYTVLYRFYCICLQPLNNIGLYYLSKKYNDKFT